MTTDISDGIAARRESVSVLRKADSLREEASVVSTRSCPASKVASSCPCCCHSNRKGLDVGEMGWRAFFFVVVTFSPMML